MAELREYVPGPHDRITLDASPDLPPDSLDEIVLSGVDVHLERMDNDSYWIGISAGQGSSLEANFWIVKKGRSIVAKLTHLDGEHADRIPETPERSA